MSWLRSRSFLFLVSLLLLPVVYIAAQFFVGQNYLKNPSYVQGYLLQSQTWDQFGKTVLLENQWNGTQLKKALPPNGFFVFENIVPGHYRLWVGSQRVHEFRYTAGQKNLGTLRYGQEAIPQGFPLIALIPLLIGIFYFVFAVTLFLKVRHENLGLIFLVLSLPPFWVNSIDSLQNVLAFGGFEFLAAHLFYLKHYPLIFCACGFAVFFLILAGHTPVLKRTGQGLAFFIPGVALSPFFLSAFVFNSETLFKQLWGFDYSWLVKLNVASVFLAMLAGLGLLVRNYRTLNGLARRQAKTVLISSLIFGCVYIPAILVPVIFFDSHEWFAGEFILFSSVGVLGLFVAFAKAVFGDHLVAFEAMANRGFLYQTVSGLYGGTYLILFFHAHQYFSKGNAWWLFLMAAILFFQPLHQLLFRFLDRLFAPPVKNSAQLLAGASQEILGALDRARLVQKIKKALKILNANMEVRVYLRTRLELREFQIENQSQTVALKENQEKMIGDGRIKKVENPKMFQKLFPAGSFMNYYILPFVIQNRLEGWAMLALPASSHPLGVEDYHLLKALQEQISVGILNSRLYEELKETYENYKDSQEKLHKVSRLSMMGEMAAGFAHEIKNPLASISSLVQMLPQRSGDGEFHQEFTQIVPRQIERIMELVKKMLSYGQDRDLEKSQILLHEVCARNIKLLNQHAVKFGVRIELEVRHPLEIQTDSALWDEVFLNLMLNGIQAMPRGGVLRVIFSKTDQQFLIEIRDEGVGIPENALPKIFQPLFTTRQTGTGMGLAIVERNLTRVGAEIRVHSQVGIGTTFTVLVPQAS